MVAWLALVLAFLVSPQSVGRTPPELLVTDGATPIIDNPRADAVRVIAESGPIDVTLGDERRWQPRPGAAAVGVHAGRRRRRAR